MNILEVKNFTKTYPGRSNPAVNNISFAIKKGEFHAFIGANGAGKTTTIKSIVGAYSKARYEGEILINGIENWKMGSKGKLGYIPEIARFPVSMSLKKYMFHMARMSGYNSSESKKISLEILDKVGLKPLLKKSPNSFSSGQKKKALLAQALIGEPELIVMDEPAANLDPMARLDFFNILKKLNSNGTSILISSHILTELSKYADSVTILDGGKVVLSGNIKSIEEKTSEGYLLNTNQNSNVVKYLVENKISHAFNGSDEILIYMKNDDIIKNVKSFIYDKKIDIISINMKKFDLQDIYEKFVKNGSVDTGGAR
jgi:ABC-2 type transport system ATP-binding protein